jgi:hypothetical protein
LQAAAAAAATFGRHTVFGKLVRLWPVFSALALIALTPAAQAQAPTQAAPAHRNFKVSVYVVVDATRALSDPATFARQYDRVQRQAPFDKVYLEAYRDGRFASDEQLEAVKKAFEAKGVAVSGGVTLAAGGRGGQFATFDYEDPADRATAEKAVRLAARHFDEVILDDFFFYNSKSDLDIAAKGSRSWTQYRLDTMRAAARDLVLGPARQTNPKVKVIIKYPNWYEHFQGLGFDLDQEAHAFDAIYTGDETRDPEITDQLLQEYESYEVFRYFSNIRPDGGDRGGWVDTFSVRDVDRYAEQLWGTLFARAPEITLFSWGAMADEAPVPAGSRAGWAQENTSFDWDAMTKAYRPSGRPDDRGAGWAEAAGYALARIDPVLGQLGRPIGIASYKPYQSHGEDFLQDYLGNVGVPIEMTPDFPSQAPIVLLTQQAAADPDIVAKIKAQLVAGKSVVITTGLMRALQGKGIEDVVEAEVTGRSEAVDGYVWGYGAGSGQAVKGGGAPPILIPEVSFYTNDAWPLVRAVANAKGFPLLLMDRYSKGVLYVLTIPENPGDLYNLPQPVLTQLRGYLQQDFPVQLDAPDHVALYAYDNGAFVTESFRPAASSVTILVKGHPARLRGLQSGEAVSPELSARPTDRTAFKITLPAHSFAAFRPEG